MLKKWWVLAAVACGTFLATLDSSIVNIALPTLTKEFNTDLYQVKWVVISYLLVITCLLLPFGRLADQYGRKNVFQTGYLIFTIGSVLCALSPDLGWLIASRVVQALGVSMLMANGPAIIAAAFPSSERGTALGVLSMVVSAGLLSGPSVGGLLIAAFGWRSIFFVNLPVGILGMIFVHSFLTKDLFTKVEAPFDWAGAALQTILLMSFIVIFDPPDISVSGSIPFPMSRWVMALLTVIIGMVFIKVESQAKAPLFDLTLLKNRTFWSANLASFLTFVAYSSVTVLMPFFLEEVMHFSTQKAGIFMTAIPLTIFVVAPISGRLSDRFGSRWLSFFGATIGTLGLFAMSGTLVPGITEHVSPAGIVLALSSIGLATGLFQSPNNNAIMSSVPTSKLGVASALLATVRNLGLVTGTGLATSLFSWRISATGDFVASLHSTQFVAALVGVFAMFAAIAKKSKREG